MLRPNDFHAGQVWRMRNGEKFYIDVILTDVRYGIRGRSADFQKRSYLLNGRLSHWAETPLDLISIVVKRK